MVPLATLLNMHYMAILILTLASVPLAALSCCASASPVVRRNFFRM